MLTNKWLPLYVEVLLTCIACMVREAGTAAAVTALQWGPGPGELAAHAVRMCCCAEIINGGVSRNTMSPWRVPIKFGCHDHTDRFEQPTSGKTYLIQRNLVEAEFDKSTIPRKSMFANSPNIGLPWGFLRVL